MANKYTELDDSSDDKWKSKYLKSIEELKIQEQQWSDGEKNLRALIAHLTNAADTSSEKLNKQLTVLRDAINKGVAANKLKKAIDEVAESILGLDALRKKNKNEVKNQFTGLIEKINPAGKIESKLTKLSKKASKTSTAKEISPLIDDLAKLLVHGLALSEKNKEKGFLSSLMRKKESDDDFEKQDASLQSVQEETIEVELDLENAIQSLISLLEKMILPADLQVEASLIKRQLSLSVNEDVFLSSLEQTVGITADILDRVKKEKSEIEEFLKQLTGRLHELDKDIRETARIRELTHQYGKKMTEGMKTEIQTIEHGISSIDNFEELKTSIQSRVILLQNHVDNFLIKEDEKDAMVSYNPLLFAWVLINIKRIEPFPVKGKLKLFEVDYRKQR